MMQGAFQLMPYSPSSVVRRDSLPPMAFQNRPPSSPGQPFQNRPIMSPMSGPSGNPRSSPPMPAPISFSPSFRETIVVPAGVRSGHQPVGGFRQSFSGRPTSTTSPAPQSPALLKGREHSFSQSFSGRPNAGTIGTSPVPQAPALLRARSSNEMPTFDGTHNPPPMLQASPKSSKSPTLLRDASPPPTQPQQANKMKMQRSAPPAQVASKTARDFDIIGYPPEIEPEAIQKAPSRARAQRSAAPPPAAPPPYESSSSVGGDASVDRSSLMSSFTHTYESTSIARVDARTANPYPSMSGASARQEVDYVLYDVDPFNATQTPTRGTKHNRGGGPNFVLGSVLEEFPVERPRAFQASMPEPKSNVLIGAYSHWPGEEDTPVITWEDSYAFGKSITVWVLDMVGRKHPIHTTTDDDVVGLRQKIMKMPWIKTAEAAWTIHGGKEIILKRKALNKRTGKYEMLTLENGDGFKHIPTQSSIGHGTVIEPEYDDAAYGMSALALDVKGIFGTVLRGTGVESL